MPIESIRRAFHIRRRKNAHVFRNIARLWQIGQTAQTHQQILDQLHPWGDNPTLRFDNGLPKFLILLGGISFFLIFLLPQFGLSFFWGLPVTGSLFLLAFALYETDDAIEEVIRYLEEQSIETRYQLKFGRIPEHLSMGTNPTLFINQLKNTFPLFNKGSVSNQLPWYASAVLADDNGTQRPVFIFLYSYLEETHIRNADGDKIMIKRTEKNLWGAFIFDTRIHGLAISTQRQPIGFPYEFRWNSSDIQINQQLYIYGTDQLELVKTLNPALLLRLSNFFKLRRGELVFHSHQDIMCFLGDSDLFEVSSRSREIRDISTLRGHLRTFRLKHYEQLCTDMNTFLK